MYFIYAIVGMKLVCYSATEKKDMETYLIIFQALKDAAAALGINVNPSSHMIDFEMAAANASKQVFVNTNISFCHFHFAKAIWRKIQKSSRINCPWLFCLSDYRYGGFCLFRTSF